MNYLAASKHIHGVEFTVERNVIHALVIREVLQLFTLMLFNIREKYEAVSYNEFLSDLLRTHRPIQSGSQEKKKEKRKPRENAPPKEDREFFLHLKEHLG